MVARDPVDELPTECGKCGEEKENIKPFQLFDEDRWVWWCWDCRYPVIKDRIYPLNDPYGDDEEEDDGPEQTGLDAFT